MAQSIINEKKWEKADVVFLSAPYEKTASSHKGTGVGPKAVIKMLSSQIEFFSAKYKCEPTSFIKSAHQNLAGIEKLSPQKTLQKITAKCTEFAKAEKFVFLLGGEHSISLGAFHALAKKYDPKDVTILQIDAHCDLRNDDGDYSDKPTHLAHSCVMRRASELGFPLVQVGIRTYSKDEYKYFSNPRNNVEVFEWNLSKIPSIDEILKSIRTKYVYISIDVDGFDPAYMPGTGTSVQGGLEWWYGINLIEEIINKKELVGADIVEVSPQADTVLTEYGAAELAYRMITEKFIYRFKKKLK